MTYEREITDPVMIQFIILYTLARINKTVGRDLLAQIILTNCNIAYGELLVCIDNLVKTDYLHVTYDKNGIEQYDLYEKGVEAEKMLRRNVPAYIREPIADTIYPMLLEDRRKRRVQGGILPAKNKDEYSVQCVLYDDDGTCLMDLNFYCATREEGGEMFKRFKEHPDEVYADVVRALTAERKEQSEEPEEQSESDNNEEG